MDGRTLHPRPPERRIVMGVFQWYPRGSEGRPMECRHSKPTGMDAIGTGRGQHGGIEKTQPHPWGTRTCRKGMENTLHPWNNRNTRDRGSNETSVGSFGSTAEEDAKAPPRSEVGNPRLPMPPFLPPRRRKSVQVRPKKGGIRSWVSETRQPTLRVLGRTYPQSFRDLRTEPLLSGSCPDDFRRHRSPFSSVRRFTPSIRVPRCPVPRHMRTKTKTRQAETETLRYRSTECRRNNYRSDGANHIRSIGQRFNSSCTVCAMCDVLHSEGSRCNGPLENLRNGTSRCKYK